MDEDKILTIAEELLEIVPDNDDVMDDETYSNILAKTESLNDALD